MIPRLQSSSVPSNAYTIKMLHLPPVHRLIVPVLLVLLIITIYKSRQQLHFLSDFPSLEIPSQPQPAKGSVIQASTLPHHQLLRVNASSGPHGVPKAGLLGFEAVRNLNPPNNTRFSRFNQPILNPHLHALFRCPITPNPRTKHIRLASILRNITVAFPSPDHPDDRQYWNPTVMALPYWSKNQYLIAARVLTAGTVQLNTLCEANICYGRESDKREWQEPCTPEDVELLGPAGGLRCVSEPQVMQVPPTPALRCEGVHNFFADIPGFQDPRIFWSGRGEPLMLVHSG